MHVEDKIKMKQTINMFTRSQINRKRRGNFAMRVVRTQAEVVVAIRSTDRESVERAHVSSERIKAQLTQRVFARYGADVLYAEDRTHGVYLTRSRRRTKTVPLNKLVSVRDAQGRRHDGSFCPPFILFQGNYERQRTDRCTNTRG